MTLDSGLKTTADAVCTEPVFAVTGRWAATEERQVRLRMTAVRGSPVQREGEERSHLP